MPTVTGNQEETNQIGGVDIPWWVFTLCGILILIIICYFGIKAVEKREKSQEFEKSHEGARDAKLRQQRNQVARQTAVLSITRAHKKYPLPMLEAHGLKPMIWRLVINLLLPRVDVCILINNKVVFMPN